jgi:hypothetical protein
MPVTGPFPPRYEAGAAVGSGSFALVYAAEDTLLGRRVAVKVLNRRAREDAGLRARFAREAKVAALLGDHPHVVSVYDVGEWCGRPYLVMELLDGSVADRVTSGGRPARAVALRWLAQAADALDYAHARGVVHRDVKPANLLLDAHGNVRLADFGVAAVGDAAQSLTLPGAVVGTPGYLAPEVAAGGVATAASDRYSFARVAAELLPGELDATPALATDPASRPTSAAAIVASLRAESTLVASANPTRVREAPTLRARGPAPSLRHRAVRFRRAIGFLAVVAVASAGAGGYAAIRLERALRAADAPRATVPAETCAISPFHHDANIVVHGVGAARFCAAQPHIFALAGDTWSYRSGRALFTPDSGAGSLGLVCRLRRGPLSITVYDAGGRAIGHRVCGWYSAGGWRSAV